MKIFELMPEAKKLKEEHPEMTYSEIGKRIGLQESQVRAFFRVDAKKDKIREENKRIKPLAIKMFNEEVARSDIAKELGVPESRIRALLMEEIDRRILKKHIEDPNATIDGSMKEFGVTEKRVINILTRAPEGTIIHF